MKKLLFLVISLLIISPIKSMQLPLRGILSLAGEQRRQQELPNPEFDPVKQIVYATAHWGYETYNYLKPTLQCNQRTILLASGAIITAIGAGCAKNWYNSYQERDSLYNKLALKAATDCSGKTNDTATAYDFYYTFPEHAKDTNLERLIKEFNDLYKEQKQKDLFDQYIEISTYVTEQKSLLF